MKKNTLLFLFSLALLGYIWSGHSEGAGSIQGQDRTGSPLSQNYCVQCHSGGDFDLSIETFLIDEAGDTIVEYKPKTKYQFALNLEAAGAGGFGFQAVTLDSLNAFVGEFGTPPDGTQLTVLDGRSYFEHSRTSSAGEFVIEWTSPAAGTGPVSIHIAGNAVNGNSSTGGDKPDTTSLILPEALSSSLDIAGTAVPLRLYPNPAFSEFTVDLTGVQDATRLEIFNNSGTSVMDMPLNTGAFGEYDVNMDEHPAGAYFVRLTTKQGIQVKKLIRLP